MDMLSAYLWDLRAQCEQQVRCLTHAQKLLEEYLTGDVEHRENTCRQLHAQLVNVVNHNAEIRASAEEAVQRAARLASGAVHPR